MRFGDRHHLFSRRINHFSIRPTRMKKGNETAFESPSFQTR
jgi:hypothetical protein